MWVPELIFSQKKKHPKASHHNFCMNAESFVANVCWFCSASKDSFIINVISKRVPVFSIKMLLLNQKQL